MATWSDLFSIKNRTEGAEQSPAAVGDVRRALEAFCSYNQHRRARLEAQGGERVGEALRLLPLLLHVNQQGLPGYVDDPACPVGVADYSPSHSELQLARRLFPDSAPRRVGILRPEVDLVAVMGSVGTIGFSEESDLDVWICHAASRLGKGILRLFEDKVEAVEAWMRSHANLEVHLFLQDAERIRQNDFGQADLEACGSAMGALLKEEFYRTAIVLAGRSPYWWVVPPGAGPEEYSRRIEALKRESTLDPGAFVDLGWVARVPVAELFGAAIWQIVKSGRSPFKSALKMGLLEKAVRSQGDVSPLCETVKARVWKGETPDPYRVLFDEVLEYYHSRGDAETEDLLARCFYLKAGARLDPDRWGAEPKGEGDEAVLLGYVRSWGWGQRRIRHLNSFGQWKFEWVQALAKEVDRYFLRTYQRIRATLDEGGATQRITPRDLTILGRKLQAVYRRAPYKVDTLHWTARGVGETALSLYQEMLPTGEAPWMLFRGNVSAFNVDERGGDLLRSSPDPLELLVWAAQNQILTAKTRLHAKGVDRDLTVADSEGLVQLLSAFAADSDREGVSLESLLNRPVPTHLTVVPNVGQEEEGLRDIGAVSTTSWGETFYRRFEGVAAFRGFIEELFIPFLLESPNPAKIQVFVPSRKIGGVRGQHARLQKELPALGAFLGGRGLPEGVRRRHVGPEDKGFFVLDRSGDSAAYKAFGDREGLLRYLSGVGPYRKVETRVESAPGQLAILKAMVESSQAGVVDLFALEEGDLETVFVADEVGNLIHFSQTREGQPYGLAKLLCFLEQTLPDVARQPGSPLVGSNLGDAVRIHTLLYDGTCRVLTSTAELLGRAQAIGLNPRGLTIEKIPGRSGQPAGYVIQWGSQTIRSGDVPNPLEELRRRIRETRSPGLDHDIYLTRLFLDERFVAECCGPVIATGHYLFYKKAIEQRLSA